MPHIEQPLQLIILSIKVNKYKKLFFFSFVFKVMEYPQTHKQNFYPKPRKKRILSAIPSPSGGGGIVAIPSPNFWYDPLDENFYHSFVALTLIRRGLINRVTNLGLIKCEHFHYKS